MQTVMSALPLIATQKADMAPPGATQGVEPGLLSAHAPRRARVCRACNRAIGDGCCLTLFRFDPDPLAALRDALVTSPKTKKIKCSQANGPKCHPNKNRNSFLTKDRVGFGS
jgi:hypothetical protein